MNIYEFILGGDNTMTVKDYMKLPKKRLAELLVERDKMGGIVLPFTPNIKPWVCDGTHCVNPCHDCINCPTRFDSAGNITPNSN